MGKHKGTTHSIGKKHDLDKFYTKSDIVVQCLDMIQLKDYDCVIEPSAGSGSFSKRIPNVFAYDLVPEDDSIQQADWLELDKTVFSSYKKPLIIGNPLFGRQGSLAKKFLKESMTFAHTVAFILPKGFKKDSIKNTLPLNYSVATEMDLPPNSFTLNNKE